MGVLMALGTCALVFFFNPAQHGFYPRCFLFELTGLFCPGCGGLRSAHQLFHGHVLTALQFNALFVLSLPVLAMWAAQKVLGRGAVPAAKPVRSFRLVWLALAIAAVFTVLRNLPAFAWLAP
ncbi:MAG: DUF2752 domain-containing protein [Pedosphaera sp.]|nr:DUF2752 domain-containing protein [Pedosphaera sp.]